MFFQMFLERIPEDASVGLDGSRWKEWVIRSDRLVALITCVHPWSAPRAGSTLLWRTVLHDCQIRLSLRRRMQLWIRPLVFGMWFQVANKDSDLDTDLENAQAYQDMLNWHLL